MINETNKHLLTRSEDKISFLYVDMARIEQSEYGIEIVQGSTVSEIPVTTINCIILGPGCVITHKALCNISSAGCTVCVMGLNLGAYYLFGVPGTNRSQNLLRQIKYHENKNLHLQIIHKMYEIRYPGTHLKTKTVEELRGIEGKTVKECYEKCAKEYNIAWSGRCYNKDDFYDQDVVNQYITGLNHILYGITTAVINTLGFSPAIGFIHTGHMESFTFDIADLYKEKCIIPLAFKLAQDNKYDRNTMLKSLRNIVVEKKLMSQIVNDILSLFDKSEANHINAELELWGDKSLGISGKNYAYLLEKAHKY